MRRGLRRREERAEGERTEGRGKHVGKEEGQKDREARGTEKQESRRGEGRSFVIAHISKTVRSCSSLCIFS